MSLAGSTPTTGNGDLSSTGTTTFFPTNITVPLSSQQALAITRMVLTQLANTLENSESSSSNQFETLLSDPGLSIGEIQTAIQSIQTLFNQIDQDEDSVGGRQENLASTTTCQRIAAIFQEYDGTAATADLTINLLQDLDGCQDAALAQPIAELTLTLQGLTHTTTWAPERVQASIEAFNAMVNRLSPEQLAIATQNPQVQTLKALLEGLSETIARG